LSEGVLSVTYSVAVLESWQSNP